MHTATLNLPGLIFLSKQGYLIFGPPPLPLGSSRAAPTVSNFISFTPSFTKGARVYKTSGKLAASAGTKTQSSDLGLATKDESGAWERRCGARVWVMLSSAHRPTDRQVEEMKTGCAWRGWPWLRPGLMYSTPLADFDIPSTWARAAYVMGDEQGLVRCFMGCGVCLLITRLCEVSLITPTGIIKL